jgi:hypothetical protein
MSAHQNKKETLNIIANKCMHQSQAGLERLTDLNKIYCSSNIKL